MTFRRNRYRSSTARGFTLVELMVAVSGGMFIALAVFALASDASRFYKRETRVADATLAGLVGFERLRVDLARAGFLSTPNVRRDPRLCGDPIADPTWPQELKRLASVRIDLAGSPSNPTLAANSLAPDSIVLSGSYSSVDQFPIWNIQDTGATFIIFLQANIGPLARMGYAASADQAALLNQVFMAGRGLRIQDKSGELQFGTIQSTVAGPIPQVILSQNPGLRFRQGRGQHLRLQRQCHGRGGECDQLRSVRSSQSVDGLELRRRQPRLRAPLRGYGQRRLGCGSNGSGSRGTRHLGHGSCGHRGVSSGVRRGLPSRRHGHHRTAEQHGSDPSQFRPGRWAGHELGR